MSRRNGCLSLFRMTFVRFLFTAAVVVLLLSSCLPCIVAFCPPPAHPYSRKNAFCSSLLMTEQQQPPTPITFREAEVLGLKFMQEGKYEQALDAFRNAMKLPGSKLDVVRTKTLKGPSPVGGATGGTESSTVQTLDEFEVQAAYYNMACAHAQLGSLNESIQALRMALENGFDNYSTVLSDPDLDPIKKEPEFEKLMSEYEPKKGFNPFGLFGGKK